jgi:hypothetical protein
MSHIDSSLDATSTARLPQLVTLLASATRVTAVTNEAGTAIVNIGNARRVVALLNVTAAAGAAGDVLDVYIDVSIDGVTWLNAAHFTQVAGNSAAIKHYAVLDSVAVAATTFNVTADCASGVTKPYLFGTQIRARHTLVDAGSHGQSVTFGVTALIQ